ncbi:CEP76 C2 domain family protein [Leishmania donovani]|uniref:CEP76 C2 domain family protein n=1 Tax=Leishmania donovani TaxID=5661 RepID=A0A504WXJ5_LEIDO|nr:CEP76 C2 domain family protein [Leishmania donovani]
MDSLQGSSQVSPEHLKSMKSAIHSFLQETGVYDSIRDIVDTYVSEHGDEADSSENPSAIMRIVKEKGILQELVSQIQSRSTVGAVPSITVPSDGRHYLLVRVNGGRAFVDNLDLAPSTVSKRSVVFAAHFGNQRFRSAVKPCSAEPKFDEEFLFEVDATGFGFGEADLIEVSTPFHIAVLREDSQLNVAELLGENIIEWRKVLKSGYLGLTVELCGRNAGVPAGIVDLQLELVSKKRIRYKEEDIVSRVEQQRIAVTNADREFLVYSRRWWSEYQAEFGLDSPQDAARFVSLLRVTAEGTGSIGALSLEESSWLSPFIFLSQRQGYHCNHAALLCSLLLGFGIDAYCALGSCHNGEVGVFVVSRSTDARGSAKVTVWNPTSGERSSPSEQDTFATVDCMFNNKSFFANCQASNNIATTSFECYNEELWKPLNVLKLRMVPRYPSAPLLFETVAASPIERSLEIQLRAAISTYRDSFGVVTTYDDTVSYVLSQALLLYERQQSEGGAQSFALFQESVKGTLGVGKTFKAIPLNVSYLDAGSVMDVVRAASVGREILDTVVDSAKFGVRAKVFCFPERVFSVWVMIAVNYSAASIS